jgi:ABC-2 type transport system ATP-binding protein
LSAILSVRKLNRSFGTKCAVNNVSFDLNSGEIVGLLGLNGAGKSTVLSLLSGKLLADSGDIIFRGQPLSLTTPSPNQIGFVPEGAPLFEDLSVKSHLDTLAGLYGLSKSERSGAIKDLLIRFELHDVARKQISSLSKGYKRRVALAGAFLADPELLFLDEPTDGLDPIQKDRMLDLLRAKRRDHTMLISTHSLEDVAAICDRVLILDQGQLVFNDTLDALEQASGDDGIHHAFRALVGKAAA